MTKLILAFFATGVAQMANFTSGVILARMLEPATRGEYAQIIAWFGLLASIMLFGVNDSVTYYRSRNQDEGTEALSAALILSVALIAISTLLCLGVILTVFTRLSPPALSAAWLFLLYPALFQWQTICHSYFQAAAKSGVWTVLRLIPPIVYIGGLLLTIQLGEADPRHFITANLAGLFVMLVVAGCVFWLSGNQLAIPSADMTRRVFRFGYPTVTQRIAANCRDNLDRIALPFFVSNVALGHYVVASSTAFLIYVAGMTIDLVGFPAMSRAPTDEARRRIAEFLISVTFCVLVAVVIVFTLICEPVVLLLFGRDYISAVTLIPWFLIAGASHALRIVIGGAFKSFNRSGGMARFELVAAIVMIVTIFGTVAWLGVFAGVLAHLLSALVSLGMALSTSVTVLKLSPRHMFLPRRSDLSRVVQDLKATFRAGDAK